MKKKVKRKKTAKLILVDNQDRVIGYENKAKCHQGQGILHRAFTVLVTNDKNQVLIQWRSKFKKLWPLIWETSCSSHPRKGEKILFLAKKRLKEELNFTCPLRSIGKFQYQAFYKNVGSENEICSLLVGKYNGEVRRNPRETADWKWINLKELKEGVKKSPQKYAPWLKIALEVIERNFKESL